MQVAIFFGSPSDANAMKKSSEILREFGVSYEAFCVSAHRAHSVLLKALQKAENSGCRVIIAGAGLSAALPGAIAANTILPVIAVPLESSSGAGNGLSGLDALLSSVQMPPKIPVATVGIGNAKNAAYLAIQILALSDESLKQKLLDFRKSLLLDAEKNYSLGTDF